MLIELFEGVGLRCYVCCGSGSGWSTTAAALTRNVIRREPDAAGTTSGS